LCVGLQYNYGSYEKKNRDEGDLLAVTEEELANDSDSDMEYVP
jgi:hypothetical protein